MVFEHVYTVYSISNLSIYAKPCLQTARPKDIKMKTQHFIETKQAELRTTKLN